MADFNTLGASAMKQLLNGALVFSLAVAPGFAAPLPLLQRTFTTDHQLASFNITAITPETITIQTYSYAGGALIAAAAPFQLHDRFTGG
jgi:hypothetical protein